MKKLFLVLLLFLTACASSPSGDTTPAQKVFVATKAYDAALSLALAYRALPPCGSGPVICSDRAVIATIQKADIVAFEALKAAQGVVRSPTSSASAIQTALIWATEAIGAFSKVTNSLKLSTRGGSTWVHLHSPVNYSAAYPLSYRPVLQSPTSSREDSPSSSSSRMRSGTQLLLNGMS